jgi:hypothetical protein
MVGLLAIAKILYGMRILPVPCFWAGKILISQESSLNSATPHHESLFKAS